MQKDNLLREPKAQRLILFVLFWMGGLLVFLFGGNTFEIFPTNKNAVYEWGLTLGLLALTAILLRSESLRKYWRIAYALFVAAFANAYNLFLGNWLRSTLPVPGSVTQTLAIDKLSQASAIVMAIILLTWLVGDDLRSIFLQRGKLREGLIFGLISFGIFAAIFLVIAILQSSAPSSLGMTAGGVSLDTLVAASPWILVFIFANSFMEELWFRGIFLKKLSPFLGATAAIFVTALVFGMTHLGATYVSPGERFIFPTIVFALGLVNGFVMLKTDSIWGSVLFHAGYDLLVIIPILANR